MEFKLKNGKKPIFIQNVKIREIYPTKMEGSDTSAYAQIEFQARKGAMFLVSAEKMNGVWQAYGVWHEGSHWPCPGCGLLMNGDFCEPFEDELDEFFDFVLRHPSARLEASMKLKPRRKKNCEIQTAKQ